MPKDVCLFSHTSFFINQSINQASRDYCVGSEAGGSDWQYGIFFLVLELNIRYS